ncbi:MAG TPA: hypothetical protein VHB48_16685, partial [Chitinophagaceae bacterium]|nr:hypothetical protein [Chitinophagaceae bacterium]
MKALILLTALIFVAATGYSQQKMIPVTPGADNHSQYNYSNPVFSSDSIFGSVRIYPNLAVGRLTLVVNDANPCILQQGECIVYNNSGLPLAQSPFTTGTNQIYITALPAGM